MNVRGQRLARNLTWIVTGLLVLIVIVGVLLAVTTGFVLLSPSSIGTHVSARTITGPVDLAAGYDAAWTMGLAIVALTAVGFILAKLRKILRTVVAGEPFAVGNVGRLRAIAAAMGAMVVAQAVVGFVFVAPHVATTRHDFGRFDFGLVLGMLVVLVLAEVFREGARLATDAERNDLMAIRVNLDRLLLDRRMSLTELAGTVDLTLANLSVLKTGKARAIRFTTLDALCRALGCQPGDILAHEAGPEAEEDNRIADKE